MKKIVAIVGMPGAGKSYAAEYFKKAGFDYIRFGQATIDEIKKRGLDVNEQNERIIREELRKTHGMAAYAIINLNKIEHSAHHVIIDGLYSWSEYKILKEKFNKQFYVLAIYAPPALRYERLTNRADQFKNDTTHTFRSIKREDAITRDYAEIEKIEKGGPIAMADYTIINTQGIEHLASHIDSVIKELIDTE